MYVNRMINTVESRLITFGDPFERSASEVIVVITGSPGIPEFYTEFAQELHRCTRLPTCIVGLAGHDGSKHTGYIGSNLTNLNGQIEHKLDFINNHIAKDSKLHIVGHSIGAWVLVELLHRNDYLIERIKSLNLLFPTLQKFADTENGKYVNNYIRRFRRLALFVFILASLIPPVIRLYCVKIYLKIIQWPSHYLKRIFLYIDPTIQKRSFSLAFESLDTIRELNVAAINKVKHLTNVVYSKTDGWVPLNYLEDLKNFLPHISTEEINVDHAFVLKSSVLVGSVVSELINNKRKLLK